jgi:hypothetical protein
MKQLLEKLSQLQDAYDLLSKANPDPVTAQAHADRIFDQAMTLLVEPQTVAQLDRFLSALQQNPDFPDIARSYLIQSREKFVRSETELTRPMNLRPGEIEEICEIFLQRYTDGQSIQNSEELRERLQLMHSSYCQGINSVRDQPRKLKKGTKLKLVNGVAKTVAGTGMLAVNSFFLSVAPPSSPAVILSCLGGIAAFIDGLEKLNS